MQVQNIIEKMVQSWQLFCHLSCTTAIEAFAAIVVTTVATTIGCSITISVAVTTVITTGSILVATIADSIATTVGTLPLLALPLQSMLLLQ